MDLFYVLHKAIPGKKDFFSQFRKHQHKDTSELLLRTIRRTNSNIKDIPLLNAFFIELYDSLYHDVMFDKIILSKKILRLLENLALPVSCIGANKRSEELAKLCKLKG